MCLNLRHMLSIPTRQVHKQIIRKEKKWQEKEESYPMAQDP